MSTDVQNTVEELTGSCWRDDQWLGAYPLNAATALDYLSNSPYYDISCNNEKAKLQGLHPSQLPQLCPGTEFVLQDVQEPHLYVVRRQYRSAPAAVTTHAIYYILEGTIYQAPTLHAAVSSRLQRCLFNTQNAFNRMQEDLDPLIIGNKETEQSEEKRKSAAIESAAVQQRPSQEAQDRAARIDSIIVSALKQHGSLLALSLQTPFGVPAAS